MNPIIMEIPASNPVSYPIMIGSDLLLHPKKWLPEKIHPKKMVIITDETVNAIYGKKLVEALRQYHPLLFSFAPGEPSKNYQTKHDLEEKMIQHHCNRETVILALGGGVTGDLAGFIASTYMRGVPYIQLPTTLLSMIDSSVGGKTGINSPQGKNLIGAFWQPTAVVADLNCLATLSDTQIINGLVEAIKIFLTSDINYFNYVNHNIQNILDRDMKVIEKIVSQAVRLKVSVVNQDERETGYRMILNAGHTIGHALEKVTDYTVLHGYAVATGLLVEAKISQLTGFLSEKDCQTIQSIFLKLGISGDMLKNINPDDIVQATHSDKKIRSNQVQYVLIETPGQIYSDGHLFSYPVPDEIVKQALLDIRGV